MIKQYAIGNKHVNEIPKNLLQGKFLRYDKNTAILEIDGCEVECKGDGTFNNEYGGNMPYRKFTEVYEDTINDDGSEDSISLGFVEN
jgi:hypothetical protein